METFEARQLLAADIEAVAFAPNPTGVAERVLGRETGTTIGDQSVRQLEREDLNQDGLITPVDSLMLINRIGRSGEFDDAMDMNRDGRLSPADALQILNRMARSGQRSGDPQTREPGPRQPRVPTPQPAELQSLDGTGNNLENPQWGSAGIEFMRHVAADYADGISEPSGQDRPSARAISNLVSAQSDSIESRRGLSDYIWQFGQFIDHDIDLTGGSETGDGESFNIPVPTGDPFFDPFSTGTQEIGLTRSGFADGTGNSTENVRQQVNEITAFIDGSMVYGSDSERSDALRSFEGGRLLTSDDDLLPMNTQGLDNAGGPGANLFLAGDVRANEQVGLLAMHTLWVREHNRVADNIAAENPNLNDEQIFQRARRIVIGELQAITYNEYLPALLGRGAISPYEGYDPTVDASISNLFATAGFRYGHSTLSAEILRLSDDGEEVEAGNLALRDAFFNPSAISEEGIDSILKGLATQTSQEVDTRIVDDLRNFLFGPPGSGGFDLVSLNIQRGRDHGLPDYNAVREQLGLERADTFADITSDIDLQNSLERAYGSTDDIDVWVGALAEDHLRGSSVGELLQVIIADQFAAIRDGDRFWYQNVLRGETLRRVHQTRLSDVIERNTDLTSIQDHAFFVDGKGPNSDDRSGEPGIERRPRSPQNVPMPPPDQNAPNQAQAVRIPSRNNDQTMSPGNQELPPPADPQRPIRSQDVGLMEAANDSSADDNVDGEASNRSDKTLSGDAVDRVLSTQLI